MNYELLKLYQLLDEGVKRKGYRLLNSVLIYHEDELLLERYYNGFNSASRNNIKSIWKSILSVCAGIALDKGIISDIDDPVCKYLPVFDGRNHPYHPLITVRHLLTMSSGIYWNGGPNYHCPMLTQFNRCKDQLEFIADVKMDKLPGSEMVYKEWDVMVLSEVISKASRLNTFDFCNEYLYKPLEIESGRWFTFPSGLCYNIGRSSAEQAESDLSGASLGKIGLLFKNKGLWQGKRIISESYIESALSPHDLSHGQTVVKQGYGYLWWIHPNGYGCSGYGGQQINVIPEKDIVYVIQATALNRHRDYSDIVNEVVASITF